MRLIGHIREEPGAKRFSDFLYAREIDNRIEPDTDSSWMIWVLSEEQVDEARRLLAEFQARPDAREYHEASRAAEEQRQKKEQADQKFRKRYHTREDIWKQGPGRVTMALIALSALMFVISGMGTNRDVMAPFFLVAEEIARGHVWRLVTPIFIHLSPLHILFNMLWLYHLGNMVERRQGSWFLILMVLVLAVGSNLGQYAHSGPAFGGMSGVVFGLLGYVWLRGRHDPLSGYYVDRTIMTFMMIWFVFGWTGVLAIANMAHTVGLVMGLMWAWWVVRN